MNEIKKISALEAVVAEMTNELSEELVTVREAMSPYINGLVTEDTLDAWKKERAGINNLYKSNEAARTGLEKGLVAQVAPVSNIRKQISAVYKSAMDNIDKQTKEFEADRIKKKKEFCMNMYKFVVPENMRKYLPIESINQSSNWVNKTTSGETIQQDMLLALDQLNADIKTILMMHSRFQEEGLRMLEGGGDINNAMAHMAMLQSMYDIAEARKAEEERKAETEPEPLTSVMEGQQFDLETGEIFEDDIFFQKPEVVELKRERKFVITIDNLSMAEMKQIRAILDENLVEYEVKEV